MPSETGRPPKLIAPWVDAHQDLVARIEHGEALLAGPDRSDLQTKAAIWDSYNYELLRRIFDTPEKAVDYGKRLLTAFVPGNADANRQLLLQAIGRKVTKLKALKEQLAMLADQTPLMVARSRTDSPIMAALTDERSPIMDALTTTVPSSTPPTVAKAKTRVFLVHGRSARKHEIARFIQKITGQEPIILDELASSGDTLVEKIVKHADVGYAVVIVTADDFGGLQGSEPTPRARENVIFELGFFVGRLGRSKVAVLKEPSVSLPGDLGGVVYISLEGEWRLSLAQELHAEGIYVDINKALG